MNLSPEDRQLYFKISLQLLFFVNQKLKIVKDYSSVNDFTENSDREIKIKVRNALYNNIKLIDDFVVENPGKFSKEELEIAKSWKNFIRSDFYILKYLAKYTIFLTEDEPARIYGVLALTQTPEEIFGTNLPILANAVLLPFKDKIVYDGFVYPQPIIFGGGIRFELNEAYREAKATEGIITSLSPLSPPELEEKSDEIKKIE